MEVKLIVAMDDENGIGRKGDLAWKISKDMKYFKNITEGEGKNAVIMGRKTWDSIPEQYRPLSGRINVVLSRKFTKNRRLGNKYEYSSLSEALQELKNNMVECTFIIGGAEIYNLALEKEVVEMLYITKVKGKFDCDTFLDLPDKGSGVEYNKKKFFCIEESELHTSKKGIEFQFNIYKKQEEKKDKQ